MLKTNANGTFAAEKTYLYEGRQQTVREIADANGITPSTLHKRLARHNGDVDKCVTGSFDRNKPIDMTGQKYGRLTVVEMVDANEHNQRVWSCVCECGNSTNVVGSQLRYGMTKSCGCLAAEFRSQFGTLTNKTHGMANSSIYRIWRSMMDRCYLQTSHAYNRYGGRGITVCERWSNFENFYADMGSKPNGMSLERTDNDGQYSPENVHWASAKEQSNNRRSNVRYEYGEENLTIAQWAEKAGIPMKTLWSRIKRGVQFPVALLNIDLRYA